MPYPLIRSNRQRVGLRRIKVEFAHLQRIPSDNIVQITFDNDNLRAWNVHIRGPSNTPYENGIFRLYLTFPVHYPLSPCSVRMKTPINLSYEYSSHRKNMFRLFELIRRKL